MTKATRHFYYGKYPYDGPYPGPMPPAFHELRNVYKARKDGTSIEAYLGQLPDGTWVHASGQVDKGMLLPDNVWCVYW